MLLAIAGVTGAGKSFYKDLIVNKLGFEKIKIITTREIRKGEKNNEDKIFVMPDELEKMVDSGEIAYKFNLLGNTYAYTKNDLFNDKNTVFEMHYDCVYDFKKICPNIKILYLLPKSIDIAKQKLIDRNLKPEVQEKRIAEIDEHYNRYMNDENLRKQFDFVIYNNYDEESEKNVINLITKELLKI